MIRPNVMKPTSRIRIRVAATTITVAIALAGAGVAHAEEPGPLSPARFAALDSMYSAMVVFEESYGAAAMADVRRVCDALDRSDRLLAVSRRACLTSLKLLPATDAFVACTTPRTCRPVTRRLRIVLTALLVDARASNRVVAIAVAPGPCRTELTASDAVLRTIRKFRDGLRLLEQGQATGKRATIRRAERKIVAAAASLARLPTAQESRDTFRRVCAAAPTAGG